jgi:hypothetical protein
MAIRYIFWTFGIFYGYLVYFMATWYIFTVTRKIWQPCVAAAGLSLYLNGLPVVWLTLTFKTSALTNFHR